MFRSLDISGSALSAQRLRMDLISGNIANANTTRAKVENGEAIPYSRKLAVFQPTQKQSFQTSLKNAMSAHAGGGVKVSRIIEDKTPWKLVYDPEHPDAIKDVNSPQYGYVRMPNVDIATEMVDLISATRSYEANVTALNAYKAMAMKALEIGR
ncbi:flagellar basal body rod protein FlgC [Desulfuribacillus stibiiarsenatis]|uniref:Flagellar basal-body rod protein FlgC n=1 Tax=Desulfuribacillus stibiiarsenatis TaxID=1390249 RepID=A0A1E5L6R9_9FIRM|nr:flagellar basal body rod protein FlgC [Desulfuribacillus stibiiarsenatis]OEH85816.1 flagellar basal body rod protein FlgC [Desulfuribacillus stibiiarsenatis]